MKKLYTLLLITSCFTHLYVQSESHTQKLNFELKERQRTQKSINKVRNISAQCAATSVATLITLIYIVSNSDEITETMFNIANTINKLANVNICWSVPTAITTALYCIYNSAMIEEIENELLSLTDGTNTEEQE